MALILNKLSVEVGLPTAGGNSGLAYGWDSPNGAGPNSIATGGGAFDWWTRSILPNSWTEGGGGGSGCYGGGSGAHAREMVACGLLQEEAQDMQVQGVSDSTAYTGSYQSQNSNATIGCRL